MKNREIYEVISQIGHAAPCPVTERLVKAGYQQKDGYIDYAREKNIPVDYRRALPSQYWHIIESYCRRSDPNGMFRRSIVCGELILYLAEVLHCVPERELNALADRIIASAVPVRRRKGSMLPPVEYERRRWNTEIHDRCYIPICQAVEQRYSHLHPTDIPA